MRIAVINSSLQRRNHEDLWCRTIAIDYIRKSIAIDYIRKLKVEGFGFSSCCSHAKMTILL